MKNINTAILDIDKNICKNIAKFDDSDRGFLSQNILSQLRNFVEYISLIAYSNGLDIEINHDNIVKANNYVKTRGNLKFLNKFHKFLQPTASHYTLDEENSERLMLKYYEYLLKIKSYLNNTHNIDVLENISAFPIDTDSVTSEYYEKIAQKINTYKLRTKHSYNDRYYIQKIKPFFVNYEVYYEVTFTRADDYVSKFDRIIAFTKLDISNYYAVKLYISNDSIEILGKNMPIHVIDDWEVSIRPCELDNFSYLLGKNRPKAQSASKEYQGIMKYLTHTGLNLAEFLELEDQYYEDVKREITIEARVTHFFNILDESRQIIKNNQAGSNILRYLLYKMNNKILKKQFNSDSCKYLSNLQLQFGCIPFDVMPFNTALINHNPKLYDLFDCIDAEGREHELFARLITNNTEIHGKLFTSTNDIENFENVDRLIRRYNSKIYYKHNNRKLESYQDFIYIKGYEEDTVEIIKTLKELSSSGIKNYSTSVESWLHSTAYNIDCEDKENSLKQIFENSKVALIYGSAGTGKSTMINHISHFFKEHSKLYLANTNPATDNLERKVDSSNCEFKTISKFLYYRNSDVTYDVIFIDECSTVSNDYMLKVLKKASFQLLVLVGDVFQIESIRFGNWFSIAQGFIPKTSRTELTNPWRSENEELLTLWKKVRNLDDDILEHITTNNYSVTLDESIFDYSEDDQIILCLNYDGLYGINNINRFLQSNNINHAVVWGVLIYKVHDPILFNDTNRFGASIYNNLKGKIVNIEVFEDRIQFDIEIDKVINEFDTYGYDFELIENDSEITSVIRFDVNKFRSTDDDDDSSDAVVPFQVAYAVSIHKAQGLEYSSVKVVVTDEVEEMITHNIFYTAITRAKEKLKIYWSPETENKILNSLEKRNNGRDVSLLKAKNNEIIS